ncbi:MAG: peptidase M22 [Oscillospiraceae bacterium]
MSHYLGIDTSNYTTSASVYDSDSDRVYSCKKLLPVAENAVGLRQSDAVFSHIKQLAQIIAELFEGNNFDIEAVCASTRPRSVEGSYMPAFLVGDMVASSVACVKNAKRYSCSHQEGHIVAALHSAGQMELLHEEFYAFHISGGTTECLLVKPCGNLFEVELVAKTLDLNAGQLVDRIGVMLGLSFPCGKELDKLSLCCDDKFKIKPTFKGLDCHLSGVQNQCEDMKIKAKSDEYIARYVIEYIKAVIDKMTQKILQTYGKKPLLYAGGVMSNSVIKEYITNKYGGFFAEPQFSTDNASGVAIIASILDR